MPTDERVTSSPAFSARARVNALAKERIARWAADLVEDDDYILLDASTTVYHMAHYLQGCRNLTVITNGVEVARLLSHNASNTVILLGGVMRSDGSTVNGPLSERFLKDLHIRAAFVSCTGFSPEAGLTEVDILEAQLKSQMIAAARSVVALINSSKFGRVDLTPFARLGQVSHIYTDSRLSADWIDQLRRAHVGLTVCGEDTVSTFTPYVIPVDHYRVGFANLSEQLPFALDVRRGLERAAHEAGNIDLILGDNQLDGGVALQVADHLIAGNLDLAIEYQVDEKAGDVLMARFRQANIPVIAVDIPMLGATFFGADNYRAGQMAGEALGEWIASHWEGQFDRVIVLEQLRSGPLPAARIRGQLDGLRTRVGVIREDKILRLDGGNTTEISEACMARALQDLAGKHHLAVLCFNDDSAIGAMSAARKRDRAADMAVVGQGADRRAREEIRRPGSPLIGSTAYMPEKYGARLVALAQSILRHEPVPPAIYSEHVFITAENVDRYYPES